MNKRTQRTPSYCLHKASGQAVVRIDATDHYLGKFGTPESRAEYDRLIAEWLGNGRRLSPPVAADSLTVDELILRLRGPCFTSSSGTVAALKTWSSSNWPFPATGTDGVGSGSGTRPGTFPRPGSSG